MKSKTAFLLIAVSLFGLAMIIQKCQPDNIKSKNTGEQNAYVGDQTCKSCHSREYNDWLSSDHFKAMELPDDSTVLGNFNNAKYIADGVTSTYFKRDNKFFINTQGADDENHDFEIKYTFGYYPLQQYLVEFPGGKLQTTRDSWDSRKEKWFHQYRGEKIDPHDWLHWTQNAQNWNTMCAGCHSTDLQKNYDLQTDTYHTTFSAINVSCEACHGPGKMHIDYVNSGDYKNGKKIPNAHLWVGKSVSQILEVNTCAPCHALRGEISDRKANSPELLDNYIPTVPTTDHFFADGQIRDEDYNYAAFLQSKMYSVGVTCSNCHSPHTGKLLYAKNQLCRQCHEKKYDEPTHTFHVANTKASECVSCHMPSRTYMGNDLRHDHSFRIPRPDLSVKYGTPNTCNSCHADKTPQWAANAVQRWYGGERAYHFSEDLIPGSRLDNKSEPHLDRLISDSSVPKIIKATAISYLGRLGSPSGLKAITNSLNDADPQVRYEALRALAAYQPSQYLAAVAPLFGDSVRAVRIAAADLATGLGAEMIPKEYIDDYSRAKTELNSYMLYQADFAHGNITIGDYYARDHDPVNAERFYKRALKMDSLANLTRINLAVLYNAQGRNKEALGVLDDAVSVDERNPQLYYDLALLHNEMGNTEAALTNFQKAFNLRFPDPRLYYNYGLMLNQKGQNAEAVTVLKAGLKISPESPDILYALAFVYHQTGQTKDAIIYGKKLKKVAPANPDFQGLYQALGL